MSLSKFQPVGSSSEGGGGSGPTLHSFFPTRESLLLKSSPVVSDAISTNLAESVLTDGDGVSTPTKSTDANSLSTKDADLQGKEKSLLNLPKTKQSSIAATSNARRAPIRPQSPVTRVAKADGEHKESSKQNIPSSSSIYSFFLKRPLDRTIDIRGTEIVGAPVMGTPPSSMQSLLASSAGGVSDAPSVVPASPSSEDLHQILGASGVCPDVYSTLPREIQEEVLLNVIRYGGKDLGVLAERMCEICGEKVRVCDAQVHKDHHMALQLSQSQHCDAQAFNDCRKEEHGGLVDRPSLTVPDLSSPSDTAQKMQGTAASNRCSVAATRPDEHSHNLARSVSIHDDSVAITDDVTSECSDSTNGHNHSEHPPDRLVSPDGSSGSTDVCTDPHHSHNQPTLAADLGPQHTLVASEQTPVLSSRAKSSVASSKKKSSTTKPLLHRKRLPGSNNLTHYLKRRKD